MITIKSEREISLMRQAGMMVSKTHKYLQKYIKPPEFCSYLFS